MITDSLFHIFPGVSAAAVPQLRPQLPSSGSLENYTLMTTLVVPVCVYLLVCGGVSLRVQQARFAVVIDQGEEVSHNCVSD